MVQQEMIVWAMSATIVLAAKSQHNPRLAPNVYFCTPLLLCNWSQTDQVVDFTIVPLYHAAIQGESCLIKIFKDAHAVMGVKPNNFL